MRMMHEYVVRATVMDPEWGVNRETVVAGPYSNKARAWSELRKWMKDAWRHTNVKDFRMYQREVGKWSECE